MSDRQELLARLREGGITEVVAEYSGSGDEGFIDQIDLFPAELGQPIRRDLDDFFWEEVIGNTQHDGFHNGDGGFGKITWNVVDDKITLDHTDYYTGIISNPPIEV